MPPPETQVTLNLRVLDNNGDPDPSDEVRVLQFMLLVVAGEYSPSHRALRPADGVDGLFGPKTEERVRLFQSREQLDVDGVVGHDTWTALLDQWVVAQLAK